MINAGSESPTETGPGYRRPAPRRRLLPIRRYTRSGRFNPNRSGGPLPIEPTPLTLPCSRTTPIRWNPPNGVNSHRRRARASATDPSPDNARDRTPTNKFCPLTLFHGLDQSQRQLLSASHPSPSVTSQCYAPSGALGPGATRIGCAYLDGLRAYG